MSETEQKQEQQQQQQQQQQEVIAEETFYTDIPNYVRTYNASPVGITPAVSAFDGKMLRDVKVRQIPGWLWSNLGTNGFVRFDMFINRKMTNPYGRASMRWVYPFIAAGMLAGMYVDAVDIRDTKKLIIEKKYGPEGLDNMHPMDRKFTDLRLTKELTKPMFI